MEMPRPMPEILSNKLDPNLYRDLWQALTNIRLREDCSDGQLIKASISIKTRLEPFLAPYVHEKFSINEERKEADLFNKLERLETGHEAKKQLQELAYHLAKIDELELSLNKIARCYVESHDGWLLRAREQAQYGVEQLSDEKPRRGRQKNFMLEYLVEGIAIWFEQLTGRPPTRTVDAYDDEYSEVSDFSRLVHSIFRIAGISASADHYVRHAAKAWRDRTT